MQFIIIINYYYFFIIIIITKRISSSSYYLEGTEMGSIHHPPTYKQDSPTKPKLVIDFLLNRVLETEETHWTF